MRARSPARLLACAAPSGLLAIAGMLLTERRHHDNESDATTSDPTNSSDEGAAGATLAGDRAPPADRDAEAIAGAERTCKQLSDSRRWRDLPGCAAQLRRLGAADRAKQIDDLASK